MGTSPSSGVCSASMRAKLPGSLNASSNEWEYAQPGQRYSAFQAGIQLANRSGALDAIEFSEFVQKLQGFADALGAMLDTPDMADAVARGKELDNFASQHDPQLVITLRANAAAWSVGYVQQCAGHHGFVPGQIAGRLVLPSPKDGEPPLLVLAYSAQAALAEDPNIGFLIPKEGSEIALDNMMIPNGAPNRENAHKFLNFFLDAKVAARNATSVAASTPNEAAKAFISKADRENPVIYPAVAVLKTLEYAQDLGANLKLYDAAWTKIKAK